MASFETYKLKTGFKLSPGMIVARQCTLENVGHSFIKLQGNQRIANLSAGVYESSFNENLKS